MPIFSKPIILVLALFATAFALASCGSSSSDEPDITVSGAWTRPVDAMIGEMDMESATEEDSDNAEDESEDDDGQMDQDAMNGPTAAVYLTIENSGGVPDTLTGASSDVAEFTEIHESAMNEGVMQMRPVTTLEIDGGETVIFEPGGFHIMLIGLIEDLQIGDEFEVVLGFEDSGEITVTSEVREGE